MSNHWSIECTTCGVGTDWGDDHRTNHQARQFTEICATGLMDAMIRLSREYRAAAPDSDWELVLRHNSNDLAVALETMPISFGGVGHAHNWEAVDEYGQWAGPEYWPDGHQRRLECVAVPVVHSVPHCTDRCES